jgi:hypothetical protein
MISINDFNNKMSYQQLINKCVNFMLKNLNVLLYNPKILQDNYGKSDSTNYIGLRKNKELSPRTYCICEWCSTGYKPNNKLYAVYWYTNTKRYICNEGYHPGRYVICRDCMFIMNQLRNTDCIHLYDEKYLEDYLDLNSYTIFPNNKWIINICTGWITKIVSFDVGYINNINYLISPEYLRLNNSYNYYGKYKNILAKFNQLIELNSHHYNILLVIYFLLKQVLIKDVSMTIGCFIISSIKNDQ